MNSSALASPRDARVSHSRRRFILQSAGMVGGLLSLPVMTHCGTGRLPSPSLPPASPTASDLLFEASFNKAKMSHYAAVTPDAVEEGVDFGLVPDPTDKSRQVAFFDSARHLSLGTRWPRSAADTPDFIKPRFNDNERDEYWMGFSVFVPVAYAIDELDGWCTLATGAYGPPWDGPSPLGLAMTAREDGQIYLVLGQDFSLLGDSVPFPFNAWLNVLLGFKFAYEGWVELSTSLGAGNRNLRPVMLQGSPRMAYDTMRRGVNDAWVQDPSRSANSASVGVYGSGAMRALFASHRLAHDRDTAISFLDQ